MASPRPASFTSTLMLLTLLVAACGSAVAPTWTPDAPTPTASPSSTEPARPLPTDTAAPTALRTGTPTSTHTPTPPPTGTPTPTAQNKAAPTLAFYVAPPADATAATAIPTPVGQFDLDKNIVNILLIGSDYRANTQGYRTDTLIVVSINKKSGVVTMLSIPRDLYVYVPGWGMQRINAAYDEGERSQFPNGGPGLLVQTLLYNLGLPIHYYALVNFGGFLKIVDTVGGVDVAVNCQVTEYRIKDPSLDESDPENYYLYTQPIGVAHMDGATALWYARARPVGGDFFRSYRQRQVLRALYHRGLQANIIPQIPALYGQFNEIVQTDMGLWETMQFAPLAAKLGDTQIRSRSIGPNQTTDWVTPGGEAVLLPKPGAVAALLDDVFNGTVEEQAAVRVEIWNLSSNPDMGRLAAETLANAGIAPIIGTPDGTAYSTTTLVDFTDGTDETTRKTLANLVHVTNGSVVAQPDPSSAVAYRLIVTDDYNSCPRLDWMDPLIVGTATPTVPAPTATATPAPTGTPTP